MLMILVIIFVIIHSTSVTDSQCSQYYRTNYLLEKLAPGEIKFTKVEKKYRDLEAQNEELSRIVKSLNQSFTQLKEENENQEKTVEEQTMEVDNIKIKLATLQNKASAVERIFQNVSSLIDAGFAFTATITGPNLYRGGQTIRFDHVITNEGNGYNANTGKFTAPRTGIYVFAITIFVYEARAYVYLMKGREQIGHVYANDYTSPYQYDRSSVTVTISLKQDDVVFVVFSSGATKRSSSLYDSWLCYFSGFLVS